MLAEGYPAADIAGILSLSLNTVETYRARMMGKLAVNDISALVKFALQQGITSLE